MNIRQDLLLIKWLDNEWFYVKSFEGKIFNFAEIIYLKGLAPGIDLQVECDLTVSGKYIR